MYKTGQLEYGYGYTLFVEGQAVPMDAIPKDLMMAPKWAEVHCFFNSLFSILFHQMLIYLSNNLDRAWELSLEALRPYPHSLRHWKQASSLGYWNRITSQKYMKAVKVTEISKLNLQGARDSARTLHVVLRQRYWYPYGWSRHFSMNIKC